MTDIRYTQPDDALVMPIDEALATYQPQGFMSVHLGGLKGKVRVFEQAAHFASLDLDAAFFDHEFVGALFRNGLVVDTWLVQAEMDFGPFVHVSGEVRAQNILLGGGYVHFAGDVTVTQTLLAGFYNHGYTVLGGQVSVPLLMSFDHGIDMDLSRLRTDALVSDDEVGGVPFYAPEHALPARIWDDGSLDVHAVLKAMKAGRVLIKGPPVSVLQKRLDKARASKAGKADLSGLKLDSVPLIIQELPALRTLDLSANRGIRVGEPLLSCPALKSLLLSDCGLTAVPEILSRLTQLEEVDLSFNRIAEIPSSWSGLSRLRALDLEGCDLTHVPPVLAEMAGLQRLALLNQPGEPALCIEQGFDELRYLSFGGQLLIPLPALETLDWGVRSSRAVPATVMGCTGLKQLDLRNARRLDGLPAELAQLQGLKEIGLTLHDDFENVEVLAQLPKLQSLVLHYRDEFLPEPFYALLDMPQWTSLQVQGWLDDSSIMRRLLERPNLKKLAVHEPGEPLYIVDIARERRRLGLA